MDDTLFNSLFVADESATVTEKSETTAWPIYPSENPTKAEKIIWLGFVSWFRVFVFFVEF